MKSLNRLLFKRIDNSPLIVFRILFGGLLTAQAWGSILTGYVAERIIPKQFSFNFIGFDFIRPLPGNWMYLFYILMGFFGLGVALGYKYKFSIGAYTLMWTYTYLMHKVGYNNHYYLLILLCVFMWMAPAHRYASIDVKRDPQKKALSMPRWISLFIVLQMGIVYTFAAVAKIYPDWLNGRMADILMASKAHYPVIGAFLQTPFSIWSLTYFGILFDLLIVPLMLWKRTRTFTFCVAIFFHLFNSIVFQIGIFPYLALALFIFFFPTQTVHQYLLKRKPYYDKNVVDYPSHKNFLLTFLGIWFVVQLILPLRHWFIQGNVLWTEEGHRMAWRMMLRTRNGWSTFKVVNKKTGDTSLVDKGSMLTPRQQIATATKPDIIWQFCQILKRKFAAKGEDVAIYVEAHCSVNHHKSYLLINPKVDMAQAKWNYFGHNTWIMPAPPALK